MAWVIVWRKYNSHLLLLYLLLFGAMQWIYLVCGGRIGYIRKFVCLGLNRMARLYIAFDIYPTFINIFASYKNKERVNIILIYIQPSNHLFLYYDDGSAHNIII